MRISVWWALPAAAAAFAGPVLAGALQFNPYIEAGIDHSSNLFSRSDNVAADTIEHYYLGADAQWPWSRQRLVFAGQVSRFQYNRFGRLDHDEYNARAAWQFAVGPWVFGTASYRQQRYLSSFANRNSTQADFIRLREPQINGYLAITPSWHLHTQSHYLDYHHSLASEQRFNRRETQGLLEMQYLGGPGSRVGVGGEIIAGDFPGRGAGDPLSRRFQQDTAFVDTHWKYSGVSLIRTRLGYTARNNSGGTINRDFSGFTGRLGYERTFSANTQITSEVFRQIYSVDNVDANFVRATGAQLLLNWNYAPALTLAGAASYTRQAYQALSSGGSRRDDVTDITARFVVRPYRFLSVIFNVSAIDRNSNRANQSYKTLAGGMALRLTWQRGPR